MLLQGRTTAAGYCDCIVLNLQFGQVLPSVPNHVIGAKYRIKNRMLDTIDFACYLPSFNSHPSTKNSFSNIHVV